MASITIKDLVQHPSNDVEGFIRDLSEDELTLMGGGFWDWLGGGGLGGAGGKA